MSPLMFSVMKSGYLYSSGPLLSLCMFCISCPGDFSFSTLTREYNIAKAELFFLICSQLLQNKREIFKSARDSSRDFTRILITNLQYLLPIKPFKSVFLSMQIHNSEHIFILVVLNIRIHCTDPVILKIFANIIG